MQSLDDLPVLLDKLISAQKEKKNKTYVAKYKGRNLRMRSGKSSWKQINHAKAAVLNHFSDTEDAYVYGWEYDAPYLKRGYTDFTYQEREERRKQFRAKLWELIEIVELI